MRKENLACKVRSRRRYSSDKGQVGKIAENKLKREFDTAAPNLKWVTDVTEFKVADRKVYLSPVMDLFDRSIVSYSVSESPTVAFTNQSLIGAIETLAAGEAPMVHSDQGFQYQHSSWQKLLSDAGMAQSMSRKGNCLDNAVMENFFGHLKEEMFHHHEHAGIEAFTTDLKDYIRWYNTERISLTLRVPEPDGISGPGTRCVDFYLPSPTFGGQFSSGTRPSFVRAPATTCPTRCTANGSCA